MIAGRLQILKNDFSKFKIHGGLFVYDRGIVSIKNLISIGKIGWSTLSGIPLKIKEKNLIRSILKKGSKNNISNIVQLNKSLFYVKKVPHKFGKCQRTISYLL